MKVFYLLATLVSVSAFAPQPTNVHRQTELHMDRRSAVTQVGIAASIVAGLPSIASADGAVSKATVQRSRGIYGNRIYVLQDAVKAGDFQAVAEEKNAFILFNSGVYPGAKNKDKKAAAIEGTNAIFAAIRSKDKGALKKSFESYLASNEITGLPNEESNSKGQGYSTDYDYRLRTKAGTIYQR